jgi:hypothetical protein
MQRRDASGQPTKGQRTKRPKARKAPIAYVSGADLQEQLDRRTRELDEALQQQTATSEVLSIIRRSPADAQPVFDAIVQSAARLCNAIFSGVYLYDNDRLRVAATKNFTAEATSQIYERQELKRPDRSTVGGRTVLDRAIVHVPDVLEDPEYSRDGQSVGAITVGKREPTPFSDQQIQLLQTFADQALIHFMESHRMERAVVFARIPSIHARPPHFGGARFRRRPNRYARQNDSHSRRSSRSRLQNDRRGESWRHSHDVRRPAAARRNPNRGDRSTTQRRATVHRQAGRAGRDLCGPSRYSDREHALARRASRVASAANGDC